MNSPGWVLVWSGIVLGAVGLVWVFFGHLPWLNWLGHLPGDIRREGASGRFYFPITTCIVLSIVLSAVLWVLRRLSHR